MSIWFISLGLACAPSIINSPCVGRWYITNKVPYFLHVLDFEASPLYGKPPGFESVRSNKAPGSLTGFVSKHTSKCKMFSHLVSAILWAFHRLNKLRVFLKSTWWNINSPARQKHIKNIKSERMQEKHKRHRTRRNSTKDELTSRWDSWEKYLKAVKRGGEATAHWRWEGVTR